MAKIIDPDGLVRSSSLINVGTDGNVWIDTATKLISLAAHGSLTDTAPSSTSGVTMQTVYSYLKEEWKTDAALIKFDFPIVSITNEQFELVNGWDFADATTKNLIRDGGWALKDGAGVSQEEYVNITTLGSFDNSSTDLAYYLQDGATPTDMVLTGEVNQAVKVYGDGTHGSIDYRASFTIFLREENKTYDSYDLLTEQNISALTYKKYAMPLSNGTDLKADETDVNIAGNAPYTGMSITYYDAIDDGGPQSRTIGGVARNFSIIIDGNGGTAEEIYEFVQYQLRQTGDIDSDTDTLRGDIQEELLAFVGDTLKTKSTSLGGVYIDNFQAADTNRLVFTDDTATERTFPFVAAGTINFNDNLQNSADAVYTMFFTNDDAGDNLGYDFGTANAIIAHANTTVTATDISFTASNTITTGGAVDFSQFSIGDTIHIEGTASNDGFYEVATVNATTITTVETIATESAGASMTISEAISGKVAAAASVAFDFDYENNLQRGTGSNNVDAPVTIVAIGTDTAQHVKATGTITKSTQNNFTLVSSLERNYSNPA